MLSLIVFIVLCFFAATVGSVLTNFSLKSWYVTLRKPAWNPPNWIFAPVWTLLFIMMAVAASMVWERSPQKGLTLPMFFFFIQLLLNVAWSAFFFGLCNVRWAFFEIILLWLFILMTTASFTSVYWFAGLLFLPYFIWVSFAAFLNFTIWRLNR